ncbi:(2Fe-2S)-binding protein [Engelhardtia mirabilis]|uniref:Nicotinate dehydrogenase small FeS subunit n=1 Tax=Engelhardtia mirabilis TaxID=2528011 RepID=A0A518BME4_9BACT|nr:Nicotinate dehydrogenase small FeS subunit [Planctomycetes bacterium Pla133]QDV02470.1 Nicotinate dehydrogenase small FeS subunit [Planctomycetes bacterium Pla86]
MSEGWTLSVNGEERTFVGDGMTRLLDVLRESLGLVGTKEGCGEGECGSCSVLLDGDVVCSCLVPVFQVEGRDVRTIEDATAVPGLAALQDTMVTEGGVQCGACTPGIVLTAAVLLERSERPDRAAIREALAGNLCRCTGYERIFRAVEKLVDQRPRGAL